MADLVYNLVKGPVGWVLFIDGTRAGGVYGTKEAAFEAAMVAASFAVRSGDGVQIKNPILGQRNGVRFSNKTLCAALVEQPHLVAIKVMYTTTPRRRCIRLQSFNSSGPLANLRNGEPFRKRIDRPRRHGGGSPRWKLSRSMRGWEHLCAIDCSFRLVRRTPPAPRC
jgi:hypothetical protein